MLVSVVIVTWNNEDEIAECVNSIYEKTTGIEFEVIIVDNNSTDDTKSVIKVLEKHNLKLIFNENNDGFTKGSNKGIQNASGKYVMLLNPDTLFDNDALKILSEFMDNNAEYGACSPLLLNEDGAVQKSVRNFPGYVTMFYEFSIFSYLFPKSATFGKWKMNYLDYSKDTDVPQPMAAALMIRKKLLDEIGYMDERYMMFFNDVDLCKQIYNKDLRIRLVTAARIFHSKGTSVYKDRNRMIKVWNKDCLEYFRKHYKNSLANNLLGFMLNISGMLRISYNKIFNR